MNFSSSTFSKVWSLILALSIVGCSTVNNYFEDSDCSNPYCSCLYSFSNNHDDGSNQFSQLNEKKSLIEEKKKTTNEYSIYCFYTDPHFFSSNSDFPFDEERIKNELAYLKNACDLLGVSFVVCGGDILNNGDSKSQACYKLSSFLKMTSSFFNNHYFLIGNHDTNYQGNYFEGSSTDNYQECILPQETINNVLYNGGNSYYYFEGQYSRYYCFDSGLDWLSNSITEYQKEQICWFANSLLDDQKPHKTVLMHMALTTFSGQQSRMMQQLGDIMEAFNNKTKITVYDQIIDYSYSFGTIDYVQSGHLHVDCAFTYKEIPIVSTIPFFEKGLENQPSFDIVFEDYTNSKLYLFRIGAGEDRIISF